MIVTCYRYDSTYRNVVDKISLIPPQGGMDEPLCIDEIKVVLPAGYTFADNEMSGPTIYDEMGKPCELCLNNLKGTAILAVSATRAIGLKRAPDGKAPTPLQEARLAASLTQKQLAEASGVNVRQIQRVELGEAEAGNLTAKNLLALADALGVDPRELI